MRSVATLLMSLALAGSVVVVGVADAGQSGPMRGDTKAIVEMAIREQLTGLSPASLMPLPKACRGLSPASATDCSSEALLRVCPGECVPVAQP